MSLIIAISVLLRIVAAIWSLAVMRRLRDARVLWLTAMLVLMSFRQLLTIAASFSTGQRMKLDVTTHLDELPGLLVSVLAFVIVLHLEGYSKSSIRPGPPRAGEASRGFPILPALTIGLASILGIVAIAYFAYVDSRDALRQTVANGNLALGRTVCRVALEDLDHSDGIDNQDSIEQLNRAWEHTQAPHWSSYLCVIGPSGRLDLHTLKPEMQGTDVSQVVVSEVSGQTILELLRSRQDWSGSNKNFRGLPQLVGYHYEPAIDSLIAVHVPMATVDEELMSAVAPWLGGLAIIGGFLLPFSLGLLFQSSRRANTAALTSLHSLAESESRYRRLFENSPFCIYEFALDGSVSAVNPAGLVAAGLTYEAEVLGVGYLTRVCEEDRPRVGELFDQAKHGNLSVCELRSIRGQAYETSFVPVIDCTGEVHGVMAISQDIDDRKRSEAALRESESLFRSIFQQAAVGVAQLDTVSGVILRVNARYCEILESPAEMLVGRTWMELTHPDDLAVDLANMAWLRSGEMREFNIEKRLERKDGSFTWINLTVSPLWQPGEEPSTHIAIVQDISARKQAEESLRRSELRYRSLVTASAATIWISNPQGGFSTVQPMWQEFTGQPWAEHQGQGWVKMIHPDDADRMVRTWQACVDDPQTYFNDGRIFHAPTGEYRYCEAHATPIRNSDGSVREWIGTTIDVHDRKLAEIRLREQSELNEHILSTMLDGYILADATGQLIDVNPSYCELVGYERAQLLSKNIRDLEVAVLPTEIERRIAAIKEAGRLRFETAHRHQDGGDVDLDVSIAVLPEQRGEVPLIAAFVRDIRARNRAELALRESEEQYRLITESAFDGVVILEEGRMVAANQAFEEMFGYSMNELRGQGPTVITTSEFREIAEKHIEESLETPYELVGVKKDGTQINVEVLGRNMQRHGRRARVTAMRDITARKRFEMAQRELHDRNSAIVSACGEIVYEWRVKANEVIWQGDYTRILGYSPEAIGNRLASWKERVHPEDVERAIADVEAARAGRHLYDLEYRFCHADGHYLWLHDRGVPFVDDDGNLDRIIGVMRNVSVRHDQEEQLRSLNASLEDRVAERTAELAETNAELVAFAHTVSHDLRSPLRAMEGFAIALEEDYGERLDDSGHEFIQHIVTSAQRMDGLITDLLAYSRLGRAKLLISPIGLNSVVTEALRQLSVEGESRDVEVAVAEPLATVLGHRSTLVQIVANLISNALKFVPHGERPKVRLWTEASECDCVRLFVEDNGIGIDAKYQSRIFQVFERLHGIESYPGTGIGLAIVARACERLGGCCGVESQLGRGSRFWIEFPKGESDR